MAGRNGTKVTEFILLGLTDDPLIQIILFFIFFFIYMVIIMGNSLIILLTLLETSLQYPMYFFLANLSILDICYSSTNIPRMLRDFLSARKNIPFAECAAQMYISLVMGMTECILLAAMAYDRYVAICYPLHYTTIISRPVCIKLATGVWICGFLNSIPSTVLTWKLDFCGPNEINHFECESPEILTLACDDISIMEFANYFGGTLLLVIPVVFITVSYANIIKAILRIASIAARKKTFSTCGSHIAVVTLFYGSLMLSYMRPRSSASANVNKMLAVFYNTVTPMLNPLIYTLRNKEVKAALQKVAGKMMYI